MPADTVNICNRTAISRDELSNEGTNQRVTINTGLNTELVLKIGRNKTRTIGIHDSHYYSDDMGQ